GWRRHTTSRGDAMRVAIAEDSVLLREGLARLLTEAGFEVVAQCGTADDLLLKVRSYAPDVAIVDIRLPPTHNDEGLRAALEIRSRHPSVGVLVLSQYVELGLALKLLADSAEGVGYLLKDRISDVDEFVAAVRRVADGGSALDPIIVSTLLSRQRPDDPLAQLTPREREVLELMAGGSSNQGIADRLVITLRAVEKYVSSIFGKLGLPSTGSEARHSGNLAARMGRWSASHKMSAIFGWLAFIAVAFMIGNAVGTKQLDPNKTGTGESGHVDSVLRDEFKQAQVDQILIQSTTKTVDDPAFRAAIADVIRTVGGMKQVKKVESPFAAGNTERISNDRHTALVALELRTTDLKQATKLDKPVEQAIIAADGRHSGIAIEEFGLNAETQL